MKHIAFVLTSSLRFEEPSFAELMERTIEAMEVSELEDVPEATGDQPAKKEADRANDPDNEETCEPTTHHLSDALTRNMQEKCPDVGIRLQTKPDKGVWLIVSNIPMSRELSH